MPTQKKVSSAMSGDAVFRSGLCSASENKTEVMLTKLQVTQTRKDRRYTAVQSQGWRPYEFTGIMD